MEQNDMNNNLLAESLDKAAYLLDKAYISHLKNDYDVNTFDKRINEADNEDMIYTDNIRIVHVNRWIKNSEESIIDCFKNVLGVFSATGKNNIALIVKRMPQRADMYFAIRNEGENMNSFSKSSCELLISTLGGNFKGSEFEKIEYKKENDAQSIREQIFDFNNKKVNSVATVCGIPSEKSKEFVSQGIEKLLDGIIPESNDKGYILVILAKPIDSDATRQILNGYEELATSLTPFATNQQQYGENKSESKGTSESNSVTNAISDAVTKTHSINVGANVGIGNVVGVNAGYGYSHGKTHADSKADTTTKGVNYMIANGTSESSTYTYKSYPIANLIEKAEKNIKRIQNGQANGLWQYASYVLSPSSVISKNVAGYIAALSRGDESYIEPAYATEWSVFDEQDNVEKSNNFIELCEHIEHFSHPIFINVKDKTQVMATSNISTSEIAELFAFPKYSIPGLPIVECACFGREPHSLISLKKDIDIGCAYHMHTSEKQNRVFLSKDELTKHTFITGSTGSGKSNTIFKLIEQLCPVNSIKTHFLVIEPAKGEYKDVFGGRDDVTFYGTNPFKAPNLLQINPFSFPDDVHVLEHIDRLVEVFNACWPMYAAMPAILKESVEKAYEDCGWNLKISKNPGKFPSFNNLLAILPKVVDSSKYSADTSNDYKGALLTRIRSLTRGIHGQILASDISANELFSKNVIIDISRIGASETKALIMGILILKLQEFRTSENVEHNCGLRHITVLEEAHNLLRKTSSEQSPESSNLQGKSVEMLANAIAEMRTYGEGFVISDQSPGLMDMSVIRNTNTKIIMRLPDEGDRRLVGKAAGLNDSQVDELSRLEQGVAAISQSDWLEPVLCKIDRFEDGISLKKRFNKDTFEWVDDESVAIQQFLSAAFDVEHRKLTKDVIDKVRNWYGELSLSQKSRDNFENVLENNGLDDKQKILLIYNVVGNKLKNIVKREDAISEVNQTLIGKYSVEENSEVIRRINELFLLYFPLNTVLDSTAEQTERLGREVKPLC